MKFFSIRLAIASLALAMLVAPAVAQTVIRIEPDWDRPGGDYRSFEITSDVGVSGCANQCLADQKCKAYTYVRRTQYANARCYLKTWIPGVSVNSCCISGYKTPYESNMLYTQDQEYYYDRPGGDYQVLDIASPSDCKVACGRDEKCKSYTFVIAGFQGPNARCYFKSSVPNPVPNKCCISGVNPYLH